MTGGLLNFCSRRPGIDHGLVDDSGVVDDDCLVDDCRIIDNHGRGPLMFREMAIFHERKRARRQRIYIHLDADAVLKS
jgi:hypothetical protein